jgi:aspartate kinase
MSRHSVEKIGGTSMSRFEAVIDNVIRHGRTQDDLYNRIFVVSAYGGITDMLLEHKKSGKAGVYAHFAANDGNWEASLQAVADRMCEINAGFAELGLDVEAADAFVKDRISGIRNCLRDLRRLASYGHFNLDEQLPAAREMLSAVGEAHSANNSAMILQKHDVNAVCVDLSGWMEEGQLPFDEKITTTFDAIDVSSCLPIVTGYTKCAEGIMMTYDRGYSEITFSKIAVLTGAEEAVIHKEFHLSSGDPKVIGMGNARIIGKTNFDVADQLADLGMEAIHPMAAKPMEQTGIPIRIKNAFEPDHEGTLISHDYRSNDPRVEIVTGRRNMVGIEVWDPDMVGQFGYDRRLLGHLENHSISYIAKNTNANTITHYVPASAKNLDACIAEIKSTYTTANVTVRNVAIVSAIGSNMKVPGFLSKTANALAEAKINILACDQCMRQVNMQFIVDEADFEPAIKALHKGLIEG